MLACLLITATAFAQNLKPIPGPDTLRAAPGGGYVKNLIDNDIDPNKDPIKVTGFKNGSNVYTLSPKDSTLTINLSGVGSLTCTYKGFMTFKPLSTYVGTYLNITYTPSDLKSGANKTGKVVLISTKNPPRVDTTGFMAELANWTILSVKKDTCRNTGDYHVWIRGTEFKVFNITWDGIPGHYIFDTRFKNECFIYTIPQSIWDGVILKYGCKK